MHNPLQIIMISAFPAVALWLANRYAIFEAISPVILSYGFGFLLGNLPFWHPNMALTKTIIMLTVPIAIPLLLFSTDFLAWLRLAKKTVLSFVIACLSVMLFSALGAHLFVHSIEESWKVAGMLVGVYTGGTPNMTAIGLALHVKEATFVLVNGADVVISSIYFLFILSLGKQLLRSLLPPFQSKQPVEASNLEESFDVKSKPFSLRERSTAFALSLVIVGISTALSFLFFHRIIEAFAILSITTLGIASSFHKGIRKLEGTYDLGQYLLLIFCVAIGTIANFHHILSSSKALFLFVAFVIGSSALLHIFLAYLFRIDADTMIMTSMAAVFGPAFVGPVAQSLKNREIVVTGITSGLMGYAIGNYLGLLTAYLVRLLVHP